jgi:hypothetical protein
MRRPGPGCSERGRSGSRRRCARPNCVRLRRVQGPEGVDQAAVVGEAAVEVVLERREERVMRLVTGFENVQVAEEHGGPGRLAGQCGVAGVQPLALALGLLGVGVAGWNVADPSTELSVCAVTLLAIMAP